MIGNLEAMESELSTTGNKQSQMSSFLEITVGQTAKTARKYLKATGWNLDAALQLYYADNEIHSPMGTLHDATTLTGQRTGFWESDAEGAPSTPTAETSRDNLASLYRPPYHLMFNGPFDRAKDAACDQDKWLLVNLQSTKEFTSHTLNRDTWGNEAVAETISNYFTFWQVYDDTTDCTQLCTFYKLEPTPVVLVIDPITGQKMRSWRGMVEPEDLLEDLVPFMDSSPKNYRPTLSKGQRESSSMEKSSALLPEKEEITRTPQKPTFLPLPEEPAADGNLLCRVGILLPDGRRLRRNFLRTDPIQLLWSFCSSHFEEAETRQFRLTQAIPGALKTLDYESVLTFEESGLTNSMITVTWE